MDRFLNQRGASTSCLRLLARYGSLTNVCAFVHRKQKLYANKIKPIRKNGHLLLVTLLLANMIVNETLPVIADPVLGGGVQSVVVSTVLIVMYVLSPLCPFFIVIVFFLSVPFTHFGRGRHMTRHAFA